MMWYDNIWISMPLLCSSTLMAYFFGIFIRKRSGMVWFHPFLVASVVLVIFLLVFNIPFQVYETATSPFKILIELCVVSFGCFFYSHIDFIKKNFKAIFVTSITGCLVGMSIVSLVFCMADAPDDIVISALPQNIVAPFSISLSDSESGIPSLTSVLVILTGLTGSVVGHFLSSKNWVLGNLATLTIFQNGTLRGVVSGIIAGVSGVVAALIFPLYVHFFYC